MTVSMTDHEIGRVYGISAAEVRRRRRALGITRRRGQCGKGRLRWPPSIPDLVTILWTDQPSDDAVGAIFGMRGASVWQLRHKFLQLTQDAEERYWLARTFDPRVERDCDGGLAPPPTGLPPAWDSVRYEDTSAQLLAAEATAERCAVEPVANVAAINDPAPGRVRW